MSLRCVVRSTFLTGVAISAMSSTAYAQAPAATPPTAAAAPDVKQDAAAAVEDPAPLDSQIVVTARRREERLQEVPLSVTSISGERLENAGVTSSVGLTQVVPGFNFVQGGNNAQPTIRGIGTTNTASGDEPNVATYLDGVYYPNAFANVLELTNISRIEVLRGPQGTLFGRNATGGAVNVITSTPSETPALRLRAGYGSFDERRLSGYATAGLTPGVAIDLAAYYIENDGYVDDLVRGGSLGYIETYNARSKLRMVLSNAFTLTLGASYSWTNDITGLSTAPIDGNVQGRSTTPGLIVPTKPWQAALTFVPDSVSELYSFFGRAEYDMDWATVSLLASKSKAVFTGTFDSDLSTINSSNTFSRIDSTSDQIELLLTSKPGRFEWVLGGFYYFGDGGYDPRILNITRTLRDRTTGKSFAAFGELTFKATDELSLIGGLRYTTERRTLTGNSGLAGAPNVDNARTFNQLTPRAVVRYTPGGKVNLYASYSRGFKSGVYNTLTVQPEPVEPEILDAYEVGVKTLNTGAVGASASAFYYDYKDIQVSAFGPLSTSVLQNAASARVKGLELEVFARPAAGLSLRVFGTLTDSEYTDFPRAVVFVPIVNAAGVATGGNRQVLQDVSGNSLIRTPDWTVGAGVDYDLPVADGKLNLAANLFINGGFNWEAGARVKQDTYEVLNLSASYKIPGSPIELTVWAKNLTNEAYGLSVLPSTFGDGINYAPPRAVGASIQVSF